MEITLTANRQCCPDVDHAIGDLIKLLSIIDTPTEPVLEMSLTELSAWFHDRFRLQQDACSASTLGSAVAFAIRHELIRLGRVSRGKTKVTAYTGIDASMLDAILMGREEVGPFPSHLMASIPSIGGSHDDDPPEVPWDAELEKIFGPSDYYRDAEEKLELNFQDMYPDWVPDEARY